MGRMAQPQPLTIEELFLMAETDFGLSEQLWTKIQYAFMVVIGNQQAGLYHSPYEYLYTAYDDIAAIWIHEESDWSALDAIVSVIKLLAFVHLGSAFDPMLCADVLRPKTKAWHGKLGLLKEKAREEKEVRPREIDAIAPEPEVTDSVTANPPKLLNAWSFPNRAAWLQRKLADRQWDHNTLEGHNGPDHKTTLKVLAGKKVIGKVLV